MAVEAAASAAVAVGVAAAATMAVVEAEEDIAAAAVAAGTFPVAAAVVAVEVDDRRRTRYVRHFRCFRRWGILYFSFFLSILLTGFSRLTFFFHRFFHIFQETTTFTHDSLTQMQKHTHTDT